MVALVGLFAELVTVTTIRYFCWNEKIPHNLCAQAQI